VHYKRVEPDTDLVSHLEEKPNLMLFLVKQLSTKLAAAEEDSAKIKAIKDIL
jgi:hypothetical protein